MISDAIRPAIWQPLPPRPGIYVLIAQARQALNATIGRLGQLQGPAGYYGYVGSAFGPGGLRARLRHHLRPVKSPHWHLDYLHDHLRLEQVWYAKDGCAREHHWEHLWARVLLDLPDSQVPLARFGASDCTCAAHLVYWPGNPSVHRFRRLARQQIDGQGSISAILVAPNSAMRDCP